MHEFSLAQNILEIAEEAVEKNNMSKATAITLEIGTMAGVEISALETALNIIRMGTILESAEILINNLRATAVCNACHHQFDPDNIYDPCPACTNFGMTVLSGKELIVKSIELE
jgi:hydrogenase nickel incorporation protein HypA/HybF